MTLRRIISASMTVLVLVGIGWWWFDRFHSAVETALAGELKQVSFRPHVDRELVIVTDPAQMESLRDAVRTSSWREPALTERVASCDLEFEFADGRRVPMKISPTGITARNFFEVEKAFYKPPGYIVLSWDGYERVVDSAPFLRILQLQDRVRPPEPAESP